MQNNLSSVHINLDEVEHNPSAENIHSPAVRSCGRVRRDALQTHAGAVGDEVAREHERVVVGARDAEALVT